MSTEHEMFKLITILIILCKVTNQNLLQGLKSICNGHETASYPHKCK